MAAPKNPNTAEANRKRREQGDATATARLREHGYTVIPPDIMKEMVGWDDMALGGFFRSYVDRYRTSASAS